MPLMVKVAEAKARLSELLARVEAGEEVIISRGPDPIARLSPLRKANDTAEVIEEIKATRNSFALAPVTLEEILEWKAEGRR